MLQRKLMADVFSAYEARACTRLPHTPNTLYIRRSCGTVTTFGLQPVQEVTCSFYQRKFNMLLFLVFGASFLTQILCIPYIDNQSQPHIVRYDFDTDHLPNYYKYNYATSDGASRSEQGAILNPGTKEEALDVNGAVRWYDDKGKLYEMTYKAGKRGYRTIIRRVYS